MLKPGTHDASCPSNYRGIALLCALSKLFANLVEHRLTSFLWKAKRIAPEQFGFTRGRRTLDPAFILDILIDQAKANGKPLFVCFIDFTKAYDFVNRSALLFKLMRIGMEGRVFDVIQNMYSAVRSIVRVGVDTSDVIEQIAGVRQGCVLSPCLFSIYIADLPLFLQESNTIGVQLHDVWVRILLYADDGALVANSEEDMQIMRNALHAYCAKWRLIVDVGKT